MPGVTTKTFTARGKTAGGVVVPGVPFTAVSSNPSIATASVASGDQVTVTAVAAGACSITVGGAGLSLVVPVTVS